MSVEWRMEWEEIGMGFGKRNEVGWTSWFRVGMRKCDGVEKEIVALGWYGNDGGFRRDISGGRD